MENKTQLEIFCGTGGVGKTTMACSRAINLALNFPEKKILLMTIDPALRLKEIFPEEKKSSEIPLQEKHGQIYHFSNKVPLPSDQEDNSINNEGTKELKQIDLDILLMNPAVTIKKIISLTADKSSSSKEDRENRILEILGRPHGGLNEILALLELNSHISSNVYDTIILDTAPGPHFIDFLSSCNRIMDFFDSKYKDIFEFIYQRSREQDDPSNKNEEKRFFAFGRGGVLNEAKNIFRQVAASGIQKLLQLLGKVTGEQFVKEFIAAIRMVHQAQNSFLDANKLIQEISLGNKCEFFLITSAEQDKLLDSQALNDELKKFLKGSSYLIINKCNLSRIQVFREASQLKNLSQNTLQILNYLEQKEVALRNFAQENFSHVLFFPEAFYQTFHQYEQKQLNKEIIPSLILSSFWTIK